MSKLSQLLGKPEKVSIGGVEFEIKPLTVGDLSLIGNIDPDKPSQEALQKLVEKVLRDSFPDATDEEIEGFPLEHVATLSDHIARINKLKTDDTKSKLVGRLKSESAASNT